MLKRFVFGLTLMGMSMLSLAIMLAGCIVAPHGYESGVDISYFIGKSFLSPLNNKDLIPVFWGLVVLMVIGACVALASMKKEQ